MDSQAPDSFSSPNQLVCRILLVDDERDHQSLLSLMLRKAGAEVVLADNGRTAVDRAQAALAAGQPFDMILMDLRMPVLNGLEATTALRKAGFDVPIIAMTAGSLATDKAKCLAAGCDDLLTKLISRSELIGRLAEYLNRYREKPRAND